jgi:hypothetical protein
MILVGIDDTDTLDSPGTNQVARSIAAAIADRWRCVRIVRHQLLFDPRVPYTSKNSSASFLFEPVVHSGVDELATDMKAELAKHFVPGSDPGLCVTTKVAKDIVEFGHRCQREVVDRSAALQLADAHGIHLEGLGGTNDGVIGALAAVGLAASGNDGRVVQIGGFADDLGGPQPVERLRERGVMVVAGDSCQRVHRGIVELGKKLRPNLRAGCITLFTHRADTADGVVWIAEKRS